MDRRKRANSINKWLVYINLVTCLKKSIFLLSASFIIRALYNQFRAGRGVSGLILGNGILLSVDMLCKSELWILFKDENHRIVKGQGCSR